MNYYKSKELIEIITQNDKPTSLENVWIGVVQVVWLGIYL